VGPLHIFVEKSESHKATVTATAICDVCSIIIHNLSLLPANHGPLSSLQCSIALLSACANAHLCPAVALRSVNVLAALVRAGALHAIDPVRWARAVEGLAAYSVGRAVTGHVDPDVLEFSFKSPDTVVGCVGLTASAHTDPVDVAAASLNLIIVAATSGPLSAVTGRVTSSTVRDVCALASSGSAVQSRQALSALFYMIAAEPSHIVAAKSQLLQAMACCLETPGCQMAVMKLAMECVGCSNDTAVQAPELDMLFQMIRSI